MKNFPPTA